MVNSIDNYEKWESIVGKGKILPAFPGAGGSITNNILDASLTPRIIQPTTFSEITGKKTNRTQRLSQIFKHSCIPFQQVNDMHIWQLCHIGMVVPLANAYYQTEHPESVGQDKVIMKKIARELKDNFKILYDNLHTLSPYKMNIFLNTHNLQKQSFLSLFVLMKKIARELKDNFKILYDNLHTLSPYKMNIFLNTHNLQKQSFLSLFVLCF